MNGWHEKEFENKGLAPYKKTALPVVADGNVFVNGVEVFCTGKNFLEINTEIKTGIQKQNDLMVVNFNLPASINKLKLKAITTEILGKAINPDQGFENNDGTPLLIDTDFFGNKRNLKNPTAGPFEKPGESKIEIKISSENN